jgi:uncharacterized membrane protein YedE/YeeE
VRSNAAALLFGLIFGAGLLVAGMTSPAKVTAFLDVAGRWDPSLALVMAGAVGVHFTLARLVLRRPAPLFGGAFQAPKGSGVDRRLVLGAAIFGVGWGLGGVCPGPGIVDAASGSAYALVFTGAMVLGVIAARLGAPAERKDAAGAADPAASSPEACG